MEIEVEASTVGNFSLFDEMYLREFRDKFVITAVNHPLEGFSIDRFDGKVKALTGDDCLEKPSKTSIIYGVAGTLRLVTGMYVLLITSCKEVGTYLGFRVFKAQSMKFLSCIKASKQLTPLEKKDDAYFRHLLKVVESTPGLYYSYESDITLNFQRQFKLDGGRLRKPIWKQADPRYIWNRYLLEELIECKLDRFIIPLLQGSFRTAELALKDSLVTVTLISRRCTRRLGTRMWRRGANLEGDTANFVETEQLLDCEGFRSSFLQVRGSIPLLWEQIVDLSYKPRINIIDHEDTPAIVERHFHDLFQRYGRIMALDLTDKQGDEGELSRAYATQAERIPNLRYVAFDFHHLCGNGNFSNLQLLYTEISEDLEKQGFFLVDPERTILNEQSGVVRSNCIDCLDRTNVTQNFIASISLNSQLQQIGLFSSSDYISMFVEEHDKFKIMWVEHGDEISLEYAGTAALKRDVLRYGKQTLGGLITDGMSALSRYYLNNFQDGLRQDAIDLISGRLSINVDNNRTPQLNSFESLYFPLASALVIGGITLTSVTLNQVGQTQNAQQYAFSVVCAGLTAGVMALVKTNGRQFCSRPRLSVNPFD